MQVSDDNLKWSALFLVTGTALYTGYTYLSHQSRQITKQAETIHTLNKQIIDSSRQIDSLKIKLDKTHRGKARVVQSLRMEKIIKNLFKLGTRHLKNENFDLKMEIEELNLDLQAKDILLEFAEKRAKGFLKRQSFATEAYPTLSLSSKAGLFPQNGLHLTPKLKSFIPNNQGSSCQQPIPRQLILPASGGFLIGKLIFGNLLFGKNL